MTSTSKAVPGKLRTRKATPRKTNAMRSRATPGEPVSSLRCRARLRRRQAKPAKRGRGQARRCCLEPRRCRRAGPMQGEAKRAGARRGQKSCAADVEAADVEGRGAMAWRPTKAIKARQGPATRCRVRRCCAKSCSTAQGDAERDDTKQDLAMPPEAGGMPNSAMPRRTMRGQAIPRKAEAVQGKAT